MASDFGDQLPDEEKVSCFLSILVVFPHVVDAPWIINPWASSEGGRWWWWEPGTRGKARCGRILPGSAPAPAHNTGYFSVPGYTWGRCGWRGLGRTPCCGVEGGQGGDVRRRSEGEAARGFVYMVACHLHPAPPRPQAPGIPVVRV